MTLLDRQNFHLFVPLLYQVGAGELEPEEIGYPVRGVVRHFPNVHFAMAEVQGVDFARRLVWADGLAFPYDYLVLAMGSESQYYGIPGAPEHAFPLKSLRDGVTLRNEVLRRFERAFATTEATRRQQELTFAIVGGGATGVEFACALAELVRGPLTRDFRELDLRQVRVIVLELGDSLLVPMAMPLRAYALDRLARLGVEVRLGAHVQEVTAKAVQLGDGSRLPCGTTVWTAGVQGNRLARAWGLPTARAGRVPVAPALHLPERPEVYVLGDLAYLEQEGRPLPMLAAVAIQMGKWAAHNIGRQVAGDEPQPLRYHDRGTLVTLGRNSAVAEVGRRLVTGFPAWLAWLGVHTYYLMGFRRRLVVLTDWALDYLFQDRAVRLILPGRSAALPAPAPAKPAATEKEPLLHV